MVFSDVGWALHSKYANITKTSYLTLCTILLSTASQDFPDKNSRLLGDKEMKFASRMSGTYQNIFSCRHRSIFRQYCGRVFDNLKLVNACKVKEQKSVHDNGNYHSHDCDVCNEILYVSVKLNAVLEWQLSWLP